ncbi:MAG: zinc ribbon domain-containing protein [Firmicutes bacterium]|nr:zinc ribbon domain-containing protein [Bacillota bacterium]
MPIFEFRCKKCGRKFEELVCGPSSVACPDCGGSDVEKLFSTFGYRSGSGFKSSTGGGRSACASCGGGSCSTCH